MADGLGGWGPGRSRPATDVNRALPPPKGGGMPHAVQPPPPPIPASLTPPRVRRGGAGGVRAGEAWVVAAPQSRCCSAKRGEGDSLGPLLRLGRGRGTESRPQDPPDPGGFWCGGAGPRPPPTLYGQGGGEASGVQARMERLALARRAGLTEEEIVAAVPESLYPPPQKTHTKAPSPHAPCPPACSPPPSPPLMPPRPPPRTSPPF